MSRIALGWIPLLLAPFSALALELVPGARTCPLDVNSYTVEVETFPMNVNAHGYPLLVCKGGSFTTPIEFNQSANRDKVFWSLSFRRATVAAGNFGQGLQPGECAFTDRPLTASESNRLMIAYSCNPTVKGSVLAGGVGSTLVIDGHPFSFLTRSYGRAFGFFVYRAPSTTGWSVAYSPFYPDTNSKIWRIR